VYRPRWLDSVVSVEYAPATSWTNPDDLRSAQSVNAILHNRYSARKSVSGHEKRSNMRRIAFGAAMIFVLVSPLRASADVVELKTGETVQGVLKEVNETKVVIEVGGQSITFDRAKVRAFYTGTPPPSAGAQAASPSVTEEALSALKSLKSGLSAGLSYRDYGSRVADTKVRVDRALESQSLRPEAKAPLGLAIGYYILASEAWQQKIKAGGKSTVGSTDERNSR
jgi:hypothetical protein